MAKFLHPEAPAIRIAGGWLLLGCLVVPGNAQRNSHAAAPAHKPPIVRALLISDIHLDPFQDPAKVPALASSPVADWDAILNSPASPDQQAGFAAIQKKCGPNVFDTSASLFHSALLAVRSHEQELFFATLTGDLIVHDFQCRFDAALPDRTSADEKLFVQKTMLYVINSLHAALSGKPLYVALGNNDSLCGDYRLDEHDAMFPALEETIVEASGASGVMKLRQDFRRAGSFSTPLPAPLQRTRIIILDDLPQSRRFRSCTGEPNPKPTSDQLAWLTTELDAARRQRQHAWVIAHIPPGIDPRATFIAGDVCAKRDPVRLMSSDDLGTLLSGYADVVTMTVFAHTHMDELRMLRPAGWHSGLPGVPLKIVPSITPIAGNRPSFLIAMIDPATSTMLDYTKYGAPDSEFPYSVVPDSPWPSVYSFREAYGVAGLSAAALEPLVRGLDADRDGSSAAAKTYIQNYPSGSPLFSIGPVWSSYRCLLTNRAAPDFLACACPASLEH